MTLGQVFSEKMRDAQIEIKNTVTVNTADITAKSAEEQQGRDQERQQKPRRLTPRANGLTVTDELRQELNDAARSTQQAYHNVRSTIEGECNTAAPCC